jgi:putative phosphoribosyl transferase
MSGRIKFAQRGMDVSIPVKGKIEMCASMNLVEGADSIIIIAHGSGSGRLSSRNCFVAEEFNRAGYSTLHLDLLTSDEERMDLETGEYRFDIDLLGMRTKVATRWLMESKETDQMKIVYFGSNAAAAAVLSAAADMRTAVEAVVSMSGRCDLVGYELSMVKVPTLFIVGENDTFITTVTHHAMQRMSADKQLAVVEGASHLFEESGAIEEVAEIAEKWFSKVLN